MITISSRYLLHFAHEHLSFRWTEFTSLLCKHNCNYTLISEQEHIKTRPYILLEIDEQTDEEALTKAVQDSYLTKGLYELWASSKVSLEHLALEAAESSVFKSKKYASQEQSFRVNCESFGSKLTQARKVEWMQKMTFIESFECRPNLKQPKQVYCIFEMNERREGCAQLVKEYYFGRRITEGNRSAIDKYSLKRRFFIANTSMDPMLSLITANCAKIGLGDIVYDPFAGSGSLLVAAAHKGARCLGADIDWQLLHGKSRPSRKGQKIRKQNEGVVANFQQYDLLVNYIDVLVSDVSRCPIRPGFELDSIICDPPYGIREGSEKIGSKRERKPVPTDQVRYPAKMAYSQQDLFSDLLTLAARHLKVGGRLAYFLPVARDTQRELEDFIPRHTSLELISYCEQPLTSKASRLLVLMEKIKHPEVNEIAHIPDVVNEANFRDNYFNNKPSD